MSKIMKQPSNLISSLLFLIVGLILFLNPNGIVAFISYIFGIIMITIGVVKIIEAVKAKDDINHDSVLTFGIICVVIGFILIICSSIIELVFRIFIGAWILISGINKLVISLNLKKIESKIWISLLVVSIILILIGLYVILKSNLVFSSIGLVLIIYSIISLIGYIMTLSQKNKDVIKK